MKKIAVVLGTRPETIKLVSFGLEAKKRNDCHIEFWSTGQHLDFVAPIMKDFGLNLELDLKLMTAGQSPADFFSRTVTTLSSTIQKRQPDWILVQGDTTSGAAAAVAAFYTKIPVAHVEAGLRTYDLSSPWPEEYNRRLIALSTQFHFPPTTRAAENLMRENISKDKIYVSGNTGIDALMWMIEKLRGQGGNRFQEKWYALNPEQPLILCTLHRRESFGETMLGLMQMLFTLAQTTKAQIILPLHPNPEVRKAAAIFETQKLNNLFVINPLDYQEFLWLMDRSTFLISDSGGIQEEAPTLGKPVIVARDKTERPEAIEAGANILAGTQPQNILHHARELLSNTDKLRTMTQPRFIYGDGQAAKKILDRLLNTSAPY